LSIEYGGAVYCDSLKKIRGQGSYAYKIKKFHENHKKTIMAFSDWICFDNLESHQEQTKNSTRASTKIRNYLKKILNRKARRGRSAFRKGHKDVPKISNTRIRNM
jgi:hypothetical protein